MKRCGGEELRFKTRRRIFLWINHHFSNLHLHSFLLSWDSCIWPDHMTNYRPFPFKSLMINTIVFDRFKRINTHIHSQEEHGRTYHIAKCFPPRSPSFVLFFHIGSGSCKLLCEWEEVSYLSCGRNINMVPQENVRNMQLEPHLHWPFNSTSTPPLNCHMWRGICFLSRTDTS